MNLTAKAEVWGSGAVLIFAAGLAMGWKLYGPGPAKPEPPKPEIRQTDGSLVLQRSPDSKPSPAHQIPRGAKVERVVQVVFTPSPEAMAPICGHDRRGADYPLPVMVLDLTLVRTPDGTRRVIASSPDGEVVGGLDVPVPGDVPHMPKYAIYGLLGWDTFRNQRVYGAAFSYGKGPFSFHTGALGRSVFVGAGVRW